MNLMTPASAYRVASAAAVVLAAAVALMLTVSGAVNRPPVVSIPAVSILGLANSDRGFVPG
jgi:hypothetical protein